MEFDSLCTIIQNASSRNEPCGSKFVNEQFPQTETPMNCRMSVESEDQGDKSQSSFSDHHLSSKAFLGENCKEETKEELLFEGMIELNNSCLDGQQTSIVQKSCEFKDADFIGTKKENLKLQSDVKPSDSETFCSIINNKMAVKKPDLFVPNLINPLLKRVRGGKTEISNIKGFYLKVTEDEIFEGYFPLSPELEEMTNHLDDRINSESETINSGKIISTKSKKPLKRKLNEKEIKQNGKTVKLGSEEYRNNGDNIEGKNEIVRINMEAKLDIDKKSEIPNGKLSVDKSNPKPKCDTSQQKVSAKESLSIPPPKIQIPKVPKSGDEWYDLSGGWKKRCMQRKSGSSMGGWDVYLYPPGDVKRLRSSTELMRFVKDHPEMSIDPFEVNMDLPFKVSADGKPSVATQKLITAIKEIKERGSISEKLFGATAAEKISAAQPLSFHLCKTKKQENIYAKAYHSETYLNSNHSESVFERVPEPKPDNNPYRKSYLSQSYLKRNRYAPVIFAKPKPVESQRPYTRPKLFHTKRPTMGKLFVLERLFAGSICMPTPQKVSEWSGKLDLNRVEVMQWFRVKWRAKLQYEAEMEELRDELDKIDPEHKFPPDTLNVCRQLQKFDLKKAYDMVLDPTSEIDLITEGDFVIDFETAEEDDKQHSGDEEVPTLEESSDDENIEIEYHDIKPTEE